MVQATERVDVQALLLRERIALATAAAMFVAGVLLMTVILPAEYGVDPVGTGELLGLTQIAEAGGAEAAITGGQSAISVAANTVQGSPFRRNTMTFTIGPGEGMEYKYRMERGGTIVYTWSATAPVYFEFHGEPDGAPKGYADFYEKGSGPSGSGSFVAPTSGIHGWWWENKNPTEVKLTIDAAGFVTRATEFRATGKTDHEIPPVSLPFGGS